MRKMKTFTMASTALGFGITALLAAPATAQYANDYETLTASATGELLTGQDGYYLPSAGADYYAYTYAGNDLGIVANPDGGDQFVAGRGPGDGTYARTQKDFTWGTGYVELTYDMTGLYMGVDGSADNVGSFSVQPYPGSQSYIHLFSWVDPATPTNFKGWYMSYNADGSLNNVPGVSPGAGWDNLDVNHWYRFGTILDFATNRMVYAYITDLHTGVSDGAALDGWYMEGGEAGGMPAPTGFRFFAGGGTNSDNVTAWDNMSSQSVAMAASMAGDCGEQVAIKCEGATPGGKVAIVASVKPGPWVNPTGTCNGITLDLRPGFIYGPKNLTADAAGEVSMKANMPANLCGKLLIQFVDLKSCGVSNVIKK